MILRRRMGFTLIEMLVVIVIITILVAAGGFYYRDLNYKATSNKSKEKALNVANIFDTIYKTGDFGSGSSTVTMESLPESVRLAKGVYGTNQRVDQFIGELKRQKTVSGHASNLIDDLLDDVVVSFYQPVNQIEDSDNPIELPPGYTGTMENYLKDNSDMVVYLPITIVGGRQFACDPTKQCDGFIIYYVQYYNGQFRLVPVKKAASGVFYE